MVAEKRNGQSKANRKAGYRCCIAFFVISIVLVVGWFFWLSSTTLSFIHGVDVKKCMQMAENVFEKKSSSIGERLHNTEKSSPRKPWLVFTSVGDKGRAETWTQGGNPKFDIFASYYGDDDKKLETLRGIFTRVWPAKGAKFPNYYRFRESLNGSSLLKEYSSIMVCDDDIDLHPLKAHLLFQVREDLNLSILIPAFSPQGRISWGSSVHVPNSFLRFGTFMEMTCPVFDSRVLERYMAEIYSPIVVGWGVDLLYMWYLDRVNLIREPRKTAVLDVAVITNPIGRKDGKREIDTYFPDREQTWLKFLKDRKLEKEGFLYRRAPMIRKFYKKNFSRGRMLMDGSLLTEGY